ncbi:hypothetical protein ACFLTC_01300 [Chloroflexota bacterium]
MTGESLLTEPNTDEDLRYASPPSVTSLTVWEITYLLNRVTVKEAMTKKVITIQPTGDSKNDNGLN